MKITLKGNPISTVGEAPKVGAAAPTFTATGQDLSAKSLGDYKGKVVILSAVPSLDTPVCDISTKRFNEEVGKMPGAVCLTISGDLPMAQKRWCGAAGVSNVVTLSTFRDKSFGQAYGLTIAEGALKELLARCVVVIDKTGVVRHVEVVPEIAQEPNYASALAAAKAAS